MATVEVGLLPSAVVFSHDGRTAFVSLTGDDGIAVVSLERFNLTAVLPVDEPGSLDISPRGDTLYIAGRRDRHLVVLDTFKGEVIGREPVDGNPYGVAVPGSP